MKNFRIGFEYESFILRAIAFVLDIIAILIMGYFIDISKPVNMMIVILICVILKISEYIDMINTKNKGE